MRVPNRDRQVVKVQFLPIIVNGVFVMITFTTLIIDGGFAMLNRRTAQAATDAGALAGAKRACLSQSDAKTVATIDLSSFIAKLLDLEKVISVNLGNCQVFLLK